MTVLTSSPSFTLVTPRLVESDGDAWLPANTAAGPQSVPTVSGVDQVLGYGEAVPASALFTLSDPDGSPTLQYQFWDSPGGGSLRVAGLVQPAGQVFSVAAADLAGTEYVAHSASWVETLWVRAYDGLGWSAWASLSARTNASPVCAAAERNIDLAQWRGLSEWVAVSDPDGDPPSAFEVRDLGAGADSGRLWGNGAVLAQGGTLSVASLADAWVCGALTPGTDTYEVRARDLYGWGEWVPFTLTTRAVANRAPEVSLCEAGVRVGLPLALAGKVEVSDADGDVPVAYGFWEGPGGGYLRVGGVAQASGQVVTVAGAQLADTVYVGGAAAGAESLYLRAYDGQAWGPWASASLYSYARATNSAPAVLAGDRNADPGQWRSLAELVAVEDADGDPPLRFQVRDLDVAADGARLWQGTVAPQGATLTVGSLGEVCLGGRATPGADSFAVRAFDGMDWGEWQAFTLTTRAFANHAPVASASDAGVRPNQSVALSGLLTVTDADGDAAVSYGVWDTPGGGYLRIAGAAQPAGRVVVLSQAQFAGAEYVGGTTAGSETVFVQAYDGQAWSPWASWRMDVLNQAPQTTSAGGSVPWGHVVAASTLFSASDPDVDPIAQYQFWESPGGGQLRLGGTALPQGQVVSVAAAELPALQYVAGEQAAVDTLWVRASDGYAWSGWATGPITTVGSAPQVQASYTKVGSGLATPVSSLFTVADPDGDAMTLYRFWDSPGGGYFALDGQAQPSGTTLTVTAANLSRLTYVGAEDYGPDLLYAAAHDGTGWGPWASWTVDSVLRFAEWRGTAGNDFPTLQSQPPEQIYLALQGDDGFSAPYEVYPFLMGGQGNDYYSPLYNGVEGLVTVFENGASPNDVLSIDILLDELGAATIAGRHLALTDEAGDRMIVLIDWQQPANRIEIFWVGEGEGEDFYIYQVSYAEMVEAVREADVQDIAWGTVGYSDAYVDEALTYYAAREAKLASNRGPAVTTTDRVVGHAGNSTPLSDLFSASDPDGDTVVRYELFLGYNSPQPGYLRVSGVARHEQLVTIEAAQLPAAEYVSDYVGDISHALRVRAYDGLDWGSESTVYVTTTVNHSPTVETTLTWVEAGHSVLLAPLISTRDIDGDAIVQYELSVQSGDTVRGTVYLNGQAQSLAEPLLISADDLNTLAYATGPEVSGPDWFLVRASDGTAWAGAYLGIGTEVASNLNRAPIVAYVSQTVVAMPGTG
nr:hypothetical protein [Gammaproteobacteria bacterium]